MSDPLAAFGRNEPCWCGSGEKYKSCHGAGPRWAPGAPITKRDEDGQIWISPDVALSKQAVDDLLGQMAGAPIHAPSKEMQQPPIRVSEFAVHLAEVEPLTPSLSFAEIGIQRFEVLDSLGLTTPDKLKTRLTEISDDDFDALVHATFSTARGVLDRLLEIASADNRPTSLWADAQALPALITKTLFWADHYLGPDTLSQGLLRWPSREKAARLEADIKALIDLRRLIELGTVVPVPEQVLEVLTAETVVSATQSDLERPALRDWLLPQMDIEGPTDREVIFVDPRDSDGALGTMYFYSHIVDKPDEDGIVHSVSLQPYDASHDYSEWLEQSRRQAASAYLQAANSTLAIAEVLQASVLARSPFEARLYERKGHGVGPADALIRADIPIPTDASAEIVARAVSEDAAVEALRQSVRRAFARANRTPAGMAATAEELGEDLGDQVRQLEEEIKRDKTWKLVVPAGLGAGSLLIGAAAGGPMGAAAAGLGTLGSLAPYLADRRGSRQQPAYALVLAKRGQKRR